MGLLLIPKGLNALVILTHQYQESPLFSASIKKRQKCGLAAKEANSWFDWKKKSSKRESENVLGNVLLALPGTICHTPG